MINTNIFRINLFTLLVSTVFSNYTFSALQQDSDRVVTTATHQQTHEVKDKAKKKKTLQVKLLVNQKFILTLRNFQGNL